MRKLTLVCLSLALVLYVGAAFAGGDPAHRDIFPADHMNAKVLTGAPLSAAKVDTLYLLGGAPGQGIPTDNTGKFQDDVSGAIPDLEGWTGVDLTQRTDPIWHIDTVYAENLGPAGNHAMVCFEILPPCPGETEDNPGYRNNYSEYLDFTAPGNPVSTEVRVTALINHDTETAYDYLFLQVGRENDAMEWINRWDGANVDTNGVRVAVVVDETFTVNAADYREGAILLRWWGYSDTGASDQDCWAKGDGLGAVDNVVVYFDAVEVSNEDFESAPYDWYVTFPPGVGNFAQVFPRLDDIDPCAFNDSPQVAFVDDGEIIPELDGTVGTTWTYGPGGYIKNMEGGLAGPDFHLWNEVWSPELAWPSTDYVGANFEYDSYVHFVDGSGMYYVWHVRSSSDGGATYTGWNDDNFVYYGTGQYGRNVRDVTFKIEPDRTHVQLALGVNEYGWVWDEFGTDGTPAPYFDNVVFKVYSYAGPAFTTRDLQMANDAFPSIGSIDYLNLGLNDVPFDMARNIAVSEHIVNDPGDSITCDIKAVRFGATLNNVPRMYYSIKQNSLFDPYRAVEFSATGYVEGEFCYLEGDQIPDRYAFELPDEDWLYPGDIVHYYIWADDIVGGSDVGVTTLPANLDGFGIFPGDPGYIDLRYDSDFIVHCLPTMFSDTPGDQPPMLFWNDFGDRGGENEWYTSLNSLGFVEGVDYDIFYTSAPSSGVGNGLGGRATLTQINGYETMLYTAGNLVRYTISDFDPENGDAGDDINLIDTWLQEGTKEFFATGDDLVTGLYFLETGGTDFITNWFSVNYLGRDVGSAIGGQTAPDVAPISGNSLLFDTEFVAYGGCLGINTFDAVEVAGTAERICEFLSPTGLAGQYNYAALTYNVNGGTEVIYSPVDFMFWYTPAKVEAPKTARALALEEILLHFGLTGSGSSTAVDTPASTPFAVKNYPNPFNPSTKISFSTPKAGDLSIKIYNVRGELVKTLIEKQVSAGTRDFVVWNGDDNSGNPVASGVYFARTQVAGFEQMNKLTLVK